MTRDQAAELAKLFAAVAAIYRTDPDARGTALHYEMEAERYSRRSALPTTDALDTHNPARHP